MPNKPSEKPEEKPESGKPSVPGTQIDPLLADVIKKGYDRSKKGETKQGK